MKIGNQLSDIESAIFGTGALLAHGWQSAVLAALCIISIVISHLSESKA